MKDAINPSHYKAGEIEAIDAIEAATVNKFGISSVCVANVIKYLWRYESKNGLEDVKKAKWYFSHLVRKNTNKKLPAHNQIIESAIVNKSNKEALIVSFIIEQLLLEEIPNGVDGIIEKFIEELETILIEKNNNENIRKNNELEQSDVRVPTESPENQKGLKKSTFQKLVRESSQHFGQRNASPYGGWYCSNTSAYGGCLDYEIDS